jgi:hypothetical protein
VRNDQEFGCNSGSTDYFSERSDNIGPVQNSQDTKTDPAETRSVISARKSGIY